MLIISSSFVVGFQLAVHLRLFKSCLLLKGQFLGPLKVWQSQFFQLEFLILFFHGNVSKLSHVFALSFCGCPRLPGICYLFSLSHGMCLNLSYFAVLSFSGCPMLLFTLKRGQFLHLSNLSGILLCTLMLSSCLTLKAENQQPSAITVNAWLLLSNIFCFSI